LLQISHKYKNVLFDSASNYNFIEVNEREYCLKLFDLISIELGEKFSDFTFYILFSHNSNVVPFSKDILIENKILFWFSEETGKIPSHISNNYTYIFKSYIEHEHGNIFSNPLGRVNEYYLTESIDTYKNTKLFFSGNLNLNRYKIYDLVLRLKFPIISNYRFIFRILRKIYRHRFLNLDSGKIKFMFTNGFKQGMNYSYYIEEIKKSYFVFCPKGFFSPETFRHYEAISYSCILISEVLPNTPEYKDAPFIFYNSVSQLEQIFNNIIENKYNIPKLSQQHKDFYLSKIHINTFVDKIKNILIS
jgi:hypothetical protein